MFSPDRKMTFTIQIFRMRPAMSPEVKGCVPNNKMLVMLVKTGNYK